MLRLILLLLLVANVGYGAWSQGWLAGIGWMPQDPAEPWRVTQQLRPEAITLVFLPGLTADHRLFDKQIACFEGKYNLQKK